VSEINNSTNIWFFQPNITSQVTAKKVTLFISQAPHLHQPLRKDYGFLFSVPTGAFLSLGGPDELRFFCPGAPVMPGIRFAKVGTIIPVAEVLNLIRFVSCKVFGDQVRWPGLMYRSSSATSGNFSANVTLHI